jgi:hypothetical protein
MAKKIDFYGRKTKTYVNSRDAKSGSYCTIPVLYEFSDKETRFEAENYLRTKCGAHCSTPYPPILRECIKQVVDAVKADFPNNQVKVIVDANNFCLRAAVREPVEGEGAKNRWQYANNAIPLPELALNVDAKKAPEGFKLNISTRRRLSRPASEGGGCNGCQHGGRGLQHCPLRAPKKISNVGGGGKITILLCSLLLLTPNLVLSVVTHLAKMFDSEVTISCINCNSLNMSNSAKWNQTLKICGITKLKSDIIFLSDIRLSNKNLVSCSNDVKRLFLNNPYEKYEFHYNSTKNKRGVGILIKSSLSLSITDEYRSQDENILALRATFRGTEVVLVSIYGPNSNDMAFFDNLTGYR